MVASVGWTHSDWIQLGVAIGTTLLALFTVLLARSTSKAAKEANRTRVDARAPRVVVLADAQWPPMSLAEFQDAEAQPIDLGVELPENNVDQPVSILIRTTIHVRNEGSSTALLTATPSGCEFSDVRMGPSVKGTLSRGDRLQAGESRTLAPGEGQLLVFDGARTVEQWGRSWTARSADENYRAPLTLTVEVHDQFDDGIIDTTVVEVVAFPVDDTASQKGYWWIRTIRDWKLVGDRGHRLRSGPAQPGVNIVVSGKQAQIVEGVSRLGSRCRSPPNTALSSG